MPNRAGAERRSGAVRAGRHRVVSVSQDDRATCHPTAGEPLFIPRLGYEQQRLIAILRDEGVRMTAAPLYYTTPNPELALFAAGRASLGLALDPCGHHRQLPFAARSSSFRALPYGGSPAPFDPDHDAISEREFIELAVGATELQRNRGATLLLTCAHLVGPVGSRGRELDLRLARAAITHFRTQRMDEPPLQAANPARRAIYATIAVPVLVLCDPGAALALADAYLELPADGFWVKLEGFDERARRAEIRAGGAFLAELRDGGRPVVGDQSGQLHLGLLADGLSASIGLAEGERFRFPTDWKQQSDANGDAVGRRRSAYHPKYLRAFRLGDAASSRAFANASCRCAQHGPTVAPSGRQVEAHAAVVRCRQAREALDGEVDERWEWLLASAAMATHTANDAAVDAVAPAVFRELLAGLDRRDERQRRAS
jgi:hypothetical protein